MSEYAVNQLVRNRLHGNVFQVTNVLDGAVLMADVANGDLRRSMDWHLDADYDRVEE